MTRIPCCTKPNDSTVCEPPSGPEDDCAVSHFALFDAGDDYSSVLQGALRKWEYTHGGNRSWAVAQAFGPKREDPSAHHAFNLWLDQDRLLHIIEPQTDELRTASEYEYTVASVFM